MMYVYPATEIRVVKWKLAMRIRAPIARKTLALAAILAVLTSAPVVSAMADEIRVLTSAAPRRVLQAIAVPFEHATSRRLVIEFAFAADLKRRIEAGDLFDVAILPPDMADDLVRQDKLATSSRVELGRTGLGVGVRSGTSKPDISTVDGFRRALLATSTVAYADGGASGVQFRRILARLGITESMQAKLRPQPSGSAARAVGLGGAELVVTGIAAILDVPNVTLVGLLPSELQSYIVYTGNIAVGSRQPEAARTLLDLLTSPRAIELFKSQGFEPAPKSR
jgi:molybdate transport system substrate-binding protein